MVWVAGHFGEWIQGTSGPKNAVTLVTLACPVKGAEVVWRDAPTLVIDDPSGLMTVQMAKALFATLDHPAHGEITVRPDLIPGGGAGMSTAALVALARAVGAPETTIPEACLAVEGAVDPVMLEQPDGVLWASRSAKAVSPLPRPPKAAIVAGFWGLPERTNPRDMQFPAAEDLITQWALGPDLPTAASIATASAQRTTALRGPLDDPTAEQAAQLGALGWIRSHTGPARGLIFPPDAIPANAETSLQAAGFKDVFSFITGGRI